MGAATSYWIFNCFAFWCLKNCPHFCVIITVIILLLLTGTSAVSCPAGGWSAVGLVPEWELIIRFDEETHVPVMSESARLQVTSTLFGKSIPQQYHKRPQLIFVTHVITCSSHFSHCVVVQWSNIPPKDAGNEAFCLLKWCDSFPCMTGQRGAIRKSIACPQSFNFRIVFSRTPTAVGWSKVCKGKRKYCCLWICFEGKKYCSRQHHDPGRVLHWNLCPPTKLSWLWYCSADLCRWMKRARCKPAADSAWGDDRGSTLYCTMGNNNKNSPLTDKHRQSIFMWRITNTEILLGWENKMFSSLSSASLCLWVGEECEWVSGWLGSLLCQVIFSNFLYAISPPYRLFSDFLIFSGGLSGRFGVSANVSSWRVGTP